MMVRWSMKKVVKLNYTDRTGADEISCGGCLHISWVQYSFEDAVDESTLEDGYGGGLCGECFMEMVIEEKFLVGKAPVAIPAQ